MIEQTAHEIAESMRHEPEQWAEMYLDLVAMNDRLLIMLKSAEAKRVQQSRVVH